MLLQGKYTKPAPLSPEDENKGIGKYPNNSLFIPKGGGPKGSNFRGGGKLLPEVFFQGV